MKEKKARWRIEKKPRVWLREIIAYTGRAATRAVDFNDRCRIRVFFTRERSTFKCYDMSELAMLYAYLYKEASKIKTLYHPIIVSNIYLKLNEENNFVISICFLYERSLFRIFFSFV